MNSRFRLALLILGLAQLAPASLLIDPAGGTSVGFQATDFATSVTRNLGGTFSLFGVPITSINVASNAYLGTGNNQGFYADRSISALANVTTGPVVAALYDELNFGDGSSVTEKLIANTYYAVTYSNIYGVILTPGQNTDVQVILFMADTAIGNFQFRAGDIAMSYGGNLASSVNGSFTTGVSDGTSSTGTPNASDGVLFAVSSLPAGSQFLLYRPQLLIQDDKAAVGYNVSAENMSSAPEPVTFALIGVGLIAVALLRRRA